MVKDFTLPVSFDVFIDKKWEKTEDSLVNKDLSMRDAFKYFSTYLNKNKIK